MFGGEGDDELNSDHGLDHVDGGSGNDDYFVISANALAVVTDAPSGSDRLIFDDANLSSLSVIQHPLAMSGSRTQVSSRPIPEQRHTKAISPAFGSMAMRCPIASMWWIQTIRVSHCKACFPIPVTPMTIRSLEPAAAI